MNFKHRRFLGFQKRLFSTALNNQNRECYVKDFGISYNYFPNWKNLLDNGMSKIILNRPQKMNSIGKQFLVELGECVDHVSRKRYQRINLPKFIIFRVVIIESTCEKSFSTGADLKVKQKIK